MIFSLSSFLGNQYHARGCAAMVSSFPTQLHTWPSQQDWKRNVLSARACLPELGAKAGELLSSRRPYDRDSCMLCRGEFDLPANERKHYHFNYKRHSRFFPIIL